jgi:hypothetical protein
MHFYFNRKSYCQVKNRNTSLLNHIIVEYILFLQKSGLLINSMMSSFNPEFVSSIAAKVVNMIKDCDDEYFPKVYIHHLIKLDLF